MQDRQVTQQGVTKTATEARQGQTTGRMRWVLGTSLVLAIVAMSIAYLVS